MLILKKRSKRFKSSFRKDDCIVVLTNILNRNHSKAFPSNHCFKQREEASYLRVYLDMRGGENGWALIPFNINKLSSIHIDKNTSIHIDKNTCMNWRYATKEEKNMYDKLGKPFNIDLCKK